MDLGEDGADLFASQHNGQAVRAFRIDKVVQPGDLLLKNLAVRRL